VRLGVEQCRGYTARCVLIADVAQKNDLQKIRNRIPARAVVAGSRLAGRARCPGSPGCGVVILGVLRLRRALSSPTRRVPAAQRTFFFFDLGTHALACAWRRSEPAPVRHRLSSLDTARRNARGIAGAASGSRNQSDSATRFSEGAFRDAGPRHLHALSDDASWQLPWFGDLVELDGDLITVTVSLYAIPFLGFEKRLHPCR
jgi:hypothetical protein